MNTIESPAGNDFEALFQPMHEAQREFYLWAPRDRRQMQPGGLRR